MNQSALRAIFASAVLFSGITLVQAEEGKAAAPAAGEAGTQAPNPAIEAAMAKVKELASPSEAHKALEPFVGTWTVSGQWWLSPDAPPQAMTGTATNTLIMDGRFLKQKFTGTTPGEPPFEGLGFTGYDNMRKEYQSFWLDNMATGVMFVTGQRDGAANTINFSGDFSCPMSGETHRKYRSVWRVTDADHNTYESYMTGPDGKEYKAMVIEYARQAAPVPCPQGIDRC